MGREETACTGGSEDEVYCARGGEANQGNIAPFTAPLGPRGAKKLRVTRSHT